MPGLALQRLHAPSDFKLRHDPASERARLIIRVNNISGAIEGTVAGDVFRFRQTRGPFQGGMTVNGDEMSREVRGSSGKIVHLCPGTPSCCACLRLIS